MYLCDNVTDMVTTYQLGYNSKVKKHRGIPIVIFFIHYGEVVERLKATVSKTVVRVSVPWVQIPPSSPSYNNISEQEGSLSYDRLPFFISFILQTHIFLLQIFIHII